MERKRLYRNVNDKMLCGVCRGFGEYFNVDPNLVRVGWVLLSLFTCTVGVVAYAACAPNVAARRLLRQLAGEEGSHARRLMGVYYLVTGCCYQPRLQGGRVEHLPWREVLRTRYHAETCGGLRYAQAAEATEDVCLREIWEELSAAEYRHARQLLSLLEQMVLA